MTELGIVAGMKLDINILYLVLASMSVSGIEEWAKKLTEKLKVNVPEWVWVAVVPPIALGVAFAADNGLTQVLVNWLACWAMVQLFYGTIIKVFKSLITKLAK